MLIRNSFGFSDAKTNSWAACTETLQGLLEQYMSDSRSLSSFTQILLASNTLQKSASGNTEKPQEEMNCEAPPPLLHRPPKRFLEQNHIDASSLETKRLRQDPEENYSRPFLKDTSYSREEMFEKSRSLGNSSKQLRPPPPLLKQAEVDNNGREPCTRSPQDRYALSKEKCEPNAVRNNSRLCSQGSEQTEAKKVERLSTLSPVVKPQPAPRQIEGDCKSSCGGYAFDHTAMPKIVAVHSISKSAEDVDEWERNKAFISKVKAKQNKTGPVRGEQKDVQMAKLISKQTKESTLHQSAAVNDQASEQVSFERYVLYHLLSKFQGNVDEVKRVLKQNLLQEWLSYCQGNVDPRQQMFNGVNFYELRKLYETWSQLQRTKQAHANTTQTVSNVQTQSNLHSLRSLPSGFRNSQSFPISQQFRAACSRTSQSNCSSQNVSNLNQAFPRSPVNSSRTHFQFQQQIHNGDIGAALTENCATSKNIPTQIKEKICIVSQNSPRVPIRNNSSSSSAVHLGQQNTNTTRGNNPTNSSTYKIFPPSTSSEHFPGQQTSRADICQGNSVIKRAMANNPRLLREEGQAKVFCSTQENVSRNHYEAAGRNQAKNLVQDQEQIDGTNISSVTLLHISQTNSKISPKEVLHSANFAPSSLATVLKSNIPTKLNRESVQSQQTSLLEMHGKDLVRGQETKANYLWRFKDGKLISDSMPSINDGEPITKIDIPKLGSNQQQVTDGNICNIQTSQTDTQRLHQEHKKVCGAAAAGQRCYCILEPKGDLQCTQKGKSPLQNMQQMIGHAEKSTPNTVRALLLQSQSQNVKGQDFQGIFSKPSTQVNTRSAQANQQRHAGLQEHSTQPSALFSILHNTQTTEQCHARVQTQSTQPHVNLRNVTDFQVNKQVNVDRKKGQDTKKSYAGLNNSRNTHQTYANHRIYSKMQAKGQFNASFDLTSNAQGSHQFYASHNVNMNGEANKTVSNTQGKQYCSSLDISKNSQGIQLPSDGISCTNKAQSSQQPDGQITFTDPTQGIQPSYVDLSNLRTAQELRPSSTSPKIPRDTQPKTNVTLPLPSYTKATQQSSASFLVSQRAKDNPQANSSLSKMFSTQKNSFSNASLPTSPNSQAKQQMNPSFFASHNANTKQQSNARNLLTVQLNQQSNASLYMSNKHQASQLTNPSFHVSRNAQANQPFNIRCKTSPTAQSNERSDVNANISQSFSKSLIKIVPKADETATLKHKPTPPSNPSRQRTNFNKNQSPVVVKSEKVKESEKIKEKQCSFPTSLTPKKQYNSLQQLARKVIETRKRFEMESIPWKKKILKSLEGVLMKRLRKIEKETGEEADLGGGEKSLSNEEEKREGQ